MSLALPAATWLAPSCAVTPLPGTAAKSLASRGTMPSPRVWSMMASASGCSELASSVAASLSRAFLLVPSAGTTSVTAGLPLVMVPVLSSTTVSTPRRFSRASALLNSTPISAPRPVPTMMATGVARPSAHGQLMTSTATALVMASLTLAVSASQTAKTTVATQMTTGTNTPATLSARRAMGALVALASSTSCTILARLVSAPTRVARKVKVPVRLMVAAFTVSPACFSTGMDSPVRALSSTELAPSSTMPSTGSDSPGRTRMTSPGCSCSAGTSFSEPSAATT